MFDTLLLLVESQGRLIEKDEFLKHIWPDSFVEDVALANMTRIYQGGVTTTPSFEDVRPKFLRRIGRSVETIG